MKWSIIIFCYNEADTISEVIRQAADFLSAPVNSSSEIIIVDDGSTDGTTEICRQWANTYPATIRHIRHEINKGIGHAIKTGYSAARGDLICAIPGDGQFNFHSFHDVPSLSPHQFVSFFRVNKHYNAYRHSLTTFNALFNQFFLGLTLKDVNWIKVYSRHQLSVADYQLDSSLIESEISAKLIRAGYKVIEIPTEYLPRKGGKPKGGSWKTLRKAVKELSMLYKAVKSYKHRIEV